MPQEFLVGLDSTWEGRLTRRTLGARTTLEEREALPPFPTVTWTLGSHKVFEAGNALPPLPTVAGVTPEGTDSALESDPSAAGATPPERTSPASEGNLRARGQAEPRDAAYIAAENFLTPGNGDVTVPGHLPPTLSQPSATPAVTRVTAEGTSPARESDSLAAGVTPPEGVAPASEGNPEVRL